MALGAGYSIGAKGAHYAPSAVVQLDARTIDINASAPIASKVI